MKVKLTLITICLIFLFINITSAQSLTKFSGLTYFDYFYNFTNKDSNKDKSQGFQFRRVFFTADFDVSNRLSTRFRLEVDEKTLSIQNRFVLSLKDLYAQYKIESVNLFFGLMPTPQIEVEEKYWGYRSIEKIQSDLRGMVASRDVGIALRGKTLDNNLSYWILFGNNSSQGAETDRYKRVYLQLLNQFNQYFSASIDLNFANAFQNKNYFYSRLGFYFSENELSCGITFVGGLKQKADSLNTDIKESGVSLFGNYSLQPYLRTLFRFDYYDPNTQKGRNSELTFIGGLDFKVEKNFSIIPNFIFNYYENRDLKDDLTGRITFYYQF